MLRSQDSDACATTRTDHPGSRRASARACHRAAADREASERSLLGRVMAGDASSFLELVNRHHRSLLRIAAAWGHDTESAEQIARSAWCTILEALPGFDGAGSLRAWLLRVVSELACATVPLRRADPAPDDTGERADFDREGQWVASARPESSGGTVDVPPGALHDALAALPARERVAITLRDIEGLGPDDAAAVLGVTVAVQHALLHRARTAVVRRVWSAVRR